MKTIIDMIWIITQRMKSWFVIFGYIFQEPRGKYTLLDQNGGHLLVHHTSTYDTYKKYICKTEHKLTGIRRRSLQPARLILTGKNKFISFYIIFMFYVFVSMG